MEKNYVCMEFEAMPENQSFARAVVGAYLASKDPTLEEMTEVKTAVSEAVSNAIIHGYQRRGKGKILMEMEYPKEDRIVIKITDYGKGMIDVKQAMQPLYSTEAEKEMSGMGFTVMESFVDKVLVESEPGVGTAVTLMKNLDIYHGV